MGLEVGVAMYMYMYSVMHVYDLLVVFFTLRFDYINDHCHAYTYTYRTIVFGPPSRNRYAVIFFLCGMLIWAYPFYFVRVSPHDPLL